MARLEGSLIRSERPPFGWLERWSPFSDLFGTSRRRGPDDFFTEPRLPAIVYPAVDVTETDDRYVLSAEIPGVDKKDICIECKDGVLSLQGEKRSQREENGDKGCLLERRYGAFSRSLGLPDDADPDRIDASFHDGVLRIEIRKKPGTKPRTVAIQG